MASKREEERNEKIIRGLMKLPPNRRCINCNSLGPQYVCSNFWTFICMICSGIHREFTHRVKSVSMSKFTTQEVEALQNGGNQRAREIFLKDWDTQRLRIPNSSNADKVREFIKAVYVDRKYTGINNEKPPRNMQSKGNIENDTRRASSYHSYSESPPYDFQYEDRLKKNQGGAFMRKPGSNRGLFERKAVSFIYSPGRFSDSMYEDANNEESSSRVSEYSVSSGGDPFRSSPQSPNLQKDAELSSPSINSSREIVDVGQQQNSSNPEAYMKRNGGKLPVPRPQRTVSTGSIGSFDSNSVPLQSVDSGSLFDASSDSNQPATTIEDKVSTFPSFPQSSLENFGELNVHKNSLGTPAPSSGPGTSMDLFQAPTSGFTALIDLFQNHGDALASLSSSPNCFNELSRQPSVSSLNQKLPEPSEPINEGWATFDLPRHSVPTADTKLAAVSAAKSEDEISITNINPVFSSNVGMQWSDFQTSIAHGPTSLVSNPWNEGMQTGPVPTSTSSSQPWKAFEEDNTQQQFVEMQQGINLLTVPADPSPATDPYLGLNNSERFNVDGFQTFAPCGEASFPSLLSHAPSASSFNQPILPFMSDMAHVGQKSSNPFDIGSELEPSNAFLDMTTLQAALPSSSLASPFATGVNETWFPSNGVTAQGGMSFMAVQASSSQLPNAPTPGRVSYVGGNPFA